MWKLNDNKVSVWTRLDAESDIDELIYGDHTIHEKEQDDSGSDR